MCVPLVNQDNHIRLFDSVPAGTELFEAIVAHEHIHLLQQQEGENRRQQVQCPEQVLDEQWVQDRDTLYLLEWHEVEARLHEQVVSYYRKNHELPLTLDGFHRMFMECAEDNAAMANPELRQQEAAHTMAHRSTMLNNQFWDLLLRLKDAQCRMQFIHEVLAVMYGNLLRYYGDSEASSQWLSHIARPNLYDELYPI